MDENEYIQNYISYVIMAVALVIMIYFLIKINMNNDECKTMNKLYPTLNNTISNNNSSNASSTDVALHNFFIKSAYNACSGGKYKNDSVDICNLMALIREGVRCLDFEIYSLDDAPVVATSTLQNFNVKETYNSVPFSSVMSTLVNHAFSSGTCPNYNDPLILHLRIKSANQKIYSKMARIFQTHSSKMLGGEFNYDASMNLLQSAPISALRSKIIVIVNRENDDFMDNADFMEYVNMVSNSIHMREYRFKDVKENDAELNQFNTTRMTIVLPDKGANPDNPNAELCRNNGCQMVAMMFQKADENLENNIAFFNTHRSAFVLKQTPSST